MVLLAVTGLALGATIFMPIELADACIRNARPLTHQGSPPCCCSDGPSAISYRRAAHRRLQQEKERQW